MLEFNTCCYTFQFHLLAEQYVLFNEALSFSDYCLGHLQLPPFGALLDGGRLREGEPCAQRRPHATQTDL